MFSPFINNNQERKLRQLTQRMYKTTLQTMYKDVYAFNRLILSPLENEDLTGWEMKPQMPHPLLFELGHVTLFFEHHVLRHVYQKETSLLNNHQGTPEMFDSLHNLPEERRDSNMINYTKQLRYYKKVHQHLVNFLSTYQEEKLTPFHSYLYMLGYLHNIMHLEVYLFLLHLLEVPCPYQVDTSILEFHHTVRSPPPYIHLYNPWIPIQGGTFSLGLNRTDRVVVWDNEMPKHKTSVHNFECQKQPTLNHEYVSFVEFGGYDKREYWSAKGWKWRVETHRRSHPYFWKYNETEKLWYRRHFNEWNPLHPNEPVVHVSYYEAEAYATYRSARLPTEDEYVYLTTNGGATEYPWGNHGELCSLYSNMDFTYNDVVPVDLYDENSANQWGVTNLFGNCWYWTSTPMYPFDKFEIDPIYDTYSYPFFYFRMILKGGSWATNHHLVHSQYRNAQEKKCIHHFTGIRLVRDRKPDIKLPLTLNNHSNPTSSQAPLGTKP